MAVSIHVRSRLSMCATTAMCYLYLHKIAYHLYGPKEAKTGSIFMLDSFLDYCLRLCLSLFITATSIYVRYRPTVTSDITNEVIVRSFNIVCQYWLIINHIKFGKHRMQTS